MILDPNQLSAIRQLNNNFRPLLEEIANELIKECNANKVPKETIDKTTINLIEQHGIIKGITLFLNTLQSLGDVRPEITNNGEY